MSKFDYQKYLNSSEWHQRANEEKEKANYRCDICGHEDRNLHVHHRNYKRLGNEQPGDLIVLCPGCHATIHSKPSPNPIFFVSEIRECESCGGSGDCYNCCGYGYTDDNCEICYGTGKCQVCNGKGKLKQIGYKY